MSQSALDTVSVRPRETGDSSLRSRAVGRYIPLESIGRGGMGTVTRAYDPKLHREVALKQVRPDYAEAEAEAEARLAREARAMARLSHPNVVEVYDVELGDGGVVLVMELVPGQTLRQWLGGARTSSEILAAFVEAGRGLAAAHRVGLVHRDFKPTNALVGSAGQSPSSRGPVKVTDFGLARGAGSSSVASDPPSPDSSVSTRSEGDPEVTIAGVLVGTPRYMAPEQHAGSVPDPRSDQFAFCVALWEALAGSPPFGEKGAALQAAKLGGAPAWPDSSPVPRRIVGAIRRGLSPSPRERWPSMDGLLRELGHQPLGRRRQALVVGVVACAGLALGASWIGRNSTQGALCSGGHTRFDGVWDEATKASIQSAFVAPGDMLSRDTWSRVEPILDDYRLAWIEQHRDSCEATNLRGKQSLAAMDLRTSCYNRAMAEFEATVQTLGEGDPAVVRRAVMLATGLPRLSTCTNVELLATRGAVPEDAELAATVEYARVELSRAWAMKRAARYEDADAIVATWAASPAAVEFAPLRAEVLRARGRIAEGRGEFEAAETSLRQAYVSALAGGAVDEAVKARTAQARLVGYNGQRPAKGLSLARMAVSLARYDGDPQLEARARNGLAVVLTALDKHPESEREARQALSLWEQTLEPRHPNLAVARGNLVIALRGQSRYDEAESEARLALGVWEDAVGPSHPNVAAARNNLAGILVAQGRLEDALGQFRTAHEALRAAVGDAHPQVAMTSHNIAALLWELGKYEESLLAYQGALRLTEAALGAEHPQVATTRLDLAGLLVARDQADEARVHAERALEILRKGGGSPTHRGSAAFVLARVLWAQGERSRDASLVTEARDAFERAGAAGKESSAELERWLNDR